MIRFAIVCVGLVAILATAQPSSETDANAVYSTLIAQEWPIQHARAQQAVILNTTTTNSRCFPSGKSLETDWKPVLEDYHRQNAAPKRLNVNLQLGVAYLLVDRDPVLRLFKDAGMGGWDRFYTVYPNSGGYIEVSAVGFDENHARAMVYVSHFCGEVCGGGAHHFLEKVDEKWRPAKLDVNRCVWVS
jgi:hypothetical protein